MEDGDDGQRKRPHTGKGKSASGTRGNAKGEPAPDFQGMVAGMQAAICQNTQGLFAKFKLDVGREVQQRVDLGVERMANGLEALAVHVRRVEEQSDQRHRQAEHDVRNLQQRIASTEQEQRQTWERIRELNNAMAIMEQVVDAGVGRRTRQITGHGSYRNSNDGAHLAAGGLCGDRGRHQRDGGQAGMDRVGHEKRTGKSSCLQVCWAGCDRRKTSGQISSSTAAAQGMAENHGDE